MIPFPTDVRDPHFVEKLNLFSAQQNQDAANAKVRTEYLQYAANYTAAQTHNAQLGLPVEAPHALPVMTLYQDDGSVTHPPFPDLTLPTINMQEATPAPAHQGFGGAANPGQISPETQAILTFLQHLDGEIQAIRAKLGA